MRIIYCKNVLKMTLFTFLVLFSFGVQVQGEQVKGTVTSEDGIPVPGVSILQKGTTNGVVTDFDGNYQITLATGSKTLMFSFLGFNDVERAVVGSSTINIVLTEDAQSLDEVVVVG